MTDRRIKKRHSADLIEVSSPTLQGHVLNLSIDGLAIETATPLPPGKRLSLKVDGEGRTITGRVKWSKLKGLRRSDDGDSEAIYHAGIELDDGADSDDSG